MGKNHKVLTIGDAMITMNPMVKGPLRFVTQFERKVGGAELNFAIACARLNLNSVWVSRLGKDEFGRYIFNFVRGEGVDMSNVQLMENYTTSVNFKQINEDGSGKTFYYRNNSPILSMEPKDFQDGHFDDISVIHLTGVFLAINKKNQDIVCKILEIARRKNITISFDPNIRLKLWSIGEARKAFNKVFPFVDILLTGLDEIKMITGFSDEEALKEFANTYSISELVIKDGENGSKLFKNGTWFRKEAFKVEVVDTVGAGDGFDAGYIYSCLNNKSDDEKLLFANAVGGLVSTVSGDNEGLPYLDDVENFLDNKTVIER